jgi:hypothetical protein
MALLPTKHLCDTLSPPCAQQSMSCIALGLSPLDYFYDLPALEGTRIVIRTSRSFAKKVQTHKGSTSDYAHDNPPIVIVIVTVLLPQARARRCYVRKKGNCSVFHVTLPCGKQKAAESMGITLQQVNLQEPRQRTRGGGVGWTLQLTKVPS